MFSADSVFVLPTSFRIVRGITTWPIRKRGKISRQMMMRMIEVHYSPRDFKRLAFPLSIIVDLSFVTV
ncbi:hypothetical protein ASD68_10455 [Rhodanobacter sp. Root627]|nr:hypothetical protein ASD68_10455 [Rhodanobacter sp. Root627]